MGSRRALLLSILLIFVVVYPWGTLQDHAHWNKIGWLPFVSPPVRLRDIVLNVLLFMPLGSSLAHRWRGPWSWLATVGTALLLSLCGELAQVYSHSRFPAATDVVTNVLGAGGGVYLVRRRQWSRARDVAAAQAV